MKKLMALAMLACATMFAALQYNVINYETVDPTDPAHHIKLEITESGSLWMHNDITRWNPELKDLKEIIDMRPNQYGAILEDGTLLYGTGESKRFSYDTTDGIRSGKVYTNGYFVGNFEAGDVIHFWITSLPDASEYGDSMNEIAAGDNEDLTARYNPDYDWVGHNIMDFKFNTKNGGGEDGSEDWKFVFASDETFASRGPAGAPLPGTLATLLVFGGLLGGYKKMKKSKKA